MDKPMDGFRERRDNKLPPLTQTRPQVLSTGRLDNASVDHTNHSPSTTTSSLRKKEKKGGVDMWKSSFSKIIRITKIILFKNNWI